ncbi:hypothetical protein HXX76_011215 [Chlamydomonas incerta]|uniref:Uncharacterized protein n=1 Tax=Chlamydomonas incerta TaxID=51695 RepID=A0A835SNQ1_CHLIN|nr:hypothetical protein HXX76_011215 [Chlamydomonas incerta]|eukprot:KAG2428971.1 hypothetical protein HXX76_011215 [Chlamydomonas incerta]
MSEYSAAAGNAAAESEAEAAAQGGGQRVLRLSASDFVFLALLLVVLVCVLPYKVLRVLRKWRQQQEQAALAAALQQLPSRGAVPVLLQAGLRRVLLCVRHTLAQAGSCDAGDSDMAVQDAGADAAPVHQPGDHAAEADPAAAAGLDDGREAAAAAAAAAQLQALTAQVCARLPRPAAAKGLDAVALLCDASTPWLGDAYVPALLHHFLLLDTRLLEESERHCRGRPPGSAPGAVARDGLAAAAAGQAAAPLPAGVYGRVVAALGWQRHLVDLLAWAPDGQVAAEAAARVLAAAPALAPGLAAALLQATGAVHEDGVEGRAGAAGLMAASSAGIARLASCPRVLQQLAAGVRGAAAEAGEGASVWLSCLMLLASALQRALAEGPAAPAAAAEEGADTWAAEACVALQEALCAWQEALAAAPAGPACGGLVAPGAEGASSGRLPLLPLLRDGLLPLLDEHARHHIAAQMRAQAPGQRGQRHGAEAKEEAAEAEDGEQPPPLLLPYTFVIQLRSRISLFVAAAAPAAAAAAAATAESPPFGTAAATAPGRGQAAAGLSEEDVWPRLAVGSRGVEPGVSGADGGWRSRGGGDAAARQVAPAWLFLATSCETTAAPAPGNAGAGAKGNKRANPGGSRLPAVLLSAARSAVRHQPTLRAEAPARATHGRAGPAAVVERVAAVAVALLAPGSASWLAVVREPRALAAAGPDPYSPFRLALALLELLQGGTAAAEAEAEDKEAGTASGGGRPHADGGAWRRLELQVLRMAAECIAGVEAAEQQAALQAVVVTGRTFARLRRRLASDASLQSSAGRGLVALSNRTAAVRGSFEATGRALSAAAEAQHLAAAAREMLPYAVLAPATCVRRLVLDGLMHPGQQPWVLQLLRSLAATATATAPAPAPVLAAATAVAAAGAAAGGASVLMASLGEVMQDAPRLLRTGGDRRSLLGLVEGLARAGVAPPRQVLSQLITPALQDAATADVRGGLEAADGEQQRLLAALQLAQHLLGLPGTPPTAPAASVAVGASTAAAAAAGAGGGGGGGSGGALAPAWSPVAELAAAQPAALLLAAAGVLQLQYARFDACGAVHAAVLEATGGVLERAVQLYGTHLRTVLYGAGGGAATRQQPPAALQQAEVLRELQTLARGIEAMPMRVVSVLVPVLEAASPQAQGEAEDADPDHDADPDADEQGSRSTALDSGDGGSGGAEAQLELVTAGLRARVRALAARVAAPVAWRPRALRSADVGATRALLLPVLAFAAASPAHTCALRSALLEAAADADAAEPVDEGFHSDAGGGMPHAAAACEADAAIWASWAASVVPTSSFAGGAVGALARHVAATALRGVPQLPQASLRDGLAAALAALLPTATAEQARRLLLALAPSLLLQLQAGGRGGLAALLCPAATPEPAHADAQDQREVRAAAQAAAVALAPAAAAVPSADAAGLRSAVAASLILACGAATDILVRATSGRSSGSAPQDRAAAADGTAAAAGNVDWAAAGTRGEAAAGAVGVAADRCAAHLALLTSQLAAMPPSTPGLAPVAALFFIHLSRVAGAVAAAAAAAELGAGRWLDVWQAALLSVLQQLVASLAAATAAAATDADGAGVQASATPVLLAGARAAIIEQLPRATGGVLLAALEHMCEDLGVAVQD